jgi:hypothetical protein
MWLQQRGIEATHGIAEGVEVIEYILGDLRRHDVDGVCSSR